MYLISLIVCYVIVREIIVSPQSDINTMIEQDEMFRMLVTRYAAKLVKTKKQASYMLQEKKTEVEELPLAEAIKNKSNSAIMDDAYNPSNV